jgi:transcriptional regulator with XRE-family HTH domain
MSSAWLVDNVKQTYTLRFMASELWQRIRAVRKYMQLSGEEFGALFGVSKASVSQWESASAKNRTHPELEKLKEMSKVSGAPTEWLLSDDSDCEFEFWLDDVAQNDSAIASSNKQQVSPESAAIPRNAQPLTEEAIRIGRLFDLIPEDKLVKRAIAYNAATAAIVAVLEGHTPTPTSAPKLDQKKQPV